MDRYGGAHAWDVHCDKLDRLYAESIQGAKCLDCRNCVEGFCIVLMFDVEDDDTPLTTECGMFG